MPPQISIPEMLLAVMGIGLSAGLFVLTIVLAVLGRASFRRHWATGLGVGLALFVLLLPSRIVSAIYMDWAAVLESLRGPAPPREAEAFSRPHVRRGERNPATRPAPLPGSAIAVSQWLSTTASPTMSTRRAPSHDW